MTNKLPFIIFFFIHAFTDIVLSQTVVIDLDKISVNELSEVSPEEPIPGNILHFNDIIKVKARNVIHSSFDHIPADHILTIEKGIVFIEINKIISAFNLESATKITNTNNSKIRYKIFLLQKEKPTQSLFGTSYEVIDYLASLDQITGDTLWLMQEEYLGVLQATTVSYINSDTKNAIIDNKTGKKLLLLKSASLLNISEIKEDSAILFLLNRKAQENELIAINLNQKKILWKVKGKFNNFFIDETRIYTSNRCAFDKMTGKLIWANNKNTEIVSTVGDYLIAYLHFGEDDPELLVYNKNSGELVGYLWSDQEFCKNCLGYTSCNPEFVFAQYGEGNKTAALVKCMGKLYLYIFEAKQ